MKQATLIPHWHRGIHAIHFGLLSGLVAVTFLATVVGTVFSPLWVKPADAAVSNFASNSFWNTAVPTYTALHPNSASLVQNIVSQVGSNGSSFVKDSGASPVYVANASASTVSVVPWDCGSGILPNLATQWQAVPIPFYAVPSVGGTPRMVVYQPSSATVWEFGHMRNISGQWQACTGGRVSTTSDGVFPSQYGVSASGLAIQAGQLSLSEVTAADISHVIGLSLPQTNGSTWPATQSSGATAGSPPMGLRLRLDPTINVSSLGLSAVGSAIARAAQTFGFVVWDTGPSVSVTGENSISSTIRGLPDPYNTLATSAALNGFPWDKLQALPGDYGETADLPAINQFTASSNSVAFDSTVTLAWIATSVNRCAIPGQSDNLGASGTLVIERIKAPTVFTLRCGGSGGTASSQVSVAVTGAGGSNAVPQLPPAFLIDSPYSGYANIFPELMPDIVAAELYKVVFYEAETYLYATAKPPFALDTSRLDNGRHAVKARLYYRDGRTGEKVVGITVNNSPETLFATAQSGKIFAPNPIPLAWGLVGLLFVGAFMAAGTHWGWHKAHLS